MVITTFVKEILMFNITALRHPMIWYIYHTKMKTAIKHIIITFCFALIANWSTGQFNPVIAYTPKTQFIFIGIDNPIAVSLGAYKLSEVNIKVSEGFIKNDSIDGKYLWRICSTKSDSVFLSIYCNEVLVKRFKYETKELLDPIPKLSGSCQGCINSLKRGNGISLERYNSTFEDLDVKQKVISYSIEFSDTSRNPYRYLFNQGAYLTKRSKNEIDLMRVNESIRFYNIKVQIGCEPTTRLLPSQMVFIFQN